MSATTTAACVGESSRRSSWGGGTQRLGRCQRGVAFAVMSYGQHGGHTAPELTCQAHMGGVVARRVDEKRRHPAAPGVTVMPVRPEGTCRTCGERPDWHEPGTTCPAL